MKDDRTDVYQSLCVRRSIVLSPFSVVCVEMLSSPCVDPGSVFGPSAHQKFVFRKTCLGVFYMIFSVEAEYDQKFLFFSILELLHFFLGETRFFFKISTRI